MEIHKTLTKYFYRIEAKPGGGFVGIPADATMVTIEGATREEVLQKIEEKIGAAIGKEFPGIEKLLHTDPNVYRIEAKPDGGFVAHPPSSSMQTIEGTTKDEVLKKIAESINANLESASPTGQTFVHKDYNVGGLHFTIDKKVKITTHDSSGGTQSTPTQAAWSQPSFSQSRFSATSGSQSGVDPMGPILPSKDNSGTIWRIIAMLVALGALVYVFLRR